MDKKSYALGMSIAHNMMQNGVKDLNYDDFKEGGAVEVPPSSCLDLFVVTVLTRFMSL